MKKIENKKLEKVLATLVELIEFIIISVVAYKFLNTDIIDIIIILLTFFISRFEIGSAGHYKIVSYFDRGWRKCFFWTASLILSLCLVSKLGIIIGVLYTIFTSYIISGRANIRDMSLGWKGTASKYDALRDLVAISPNNPIILEHEEYWRKNYPMRYEIFKMYFRERRTYEYIAEQKEFNDNTITKRECAAVYSILERPLNLPPIE